MIQRGMPRWCRHVVRPALIDGSECALVYGATANVLGFALPLLHRPTDATLAFAGLAQFLTLLAVLVVTVLIASGQSLFQVLFPTRPNVSIAAGPAALTLIAIGAGFATRQPALLGAGAVAATMVFLVRSSRLLNWTTGVVLAVAPFLAQPRPQDGWTAPVAAGAAVVVLLAAAVVLWRNRLRPPERGAAGWRWNAALAALILLGLAPGGLAYQTEPSLRFAAGRGAIRGTAPNVVLITLDTVRADHLSVYGYGRPTTPALRDFLDEGAVRYTRAFSTSDMTLSSHASIFTGLLPSEHGAHRRGSAPDSGMRPDVETLASRLRQSGFATVGIASNAAYLSDRFGFAAGFDYYDVRRPARLIAPYPEYFVGGQFVNWLLASAGPDAQSIYRPAADVMRQARGALRPLKDSGQPFFLFLNLMDAHTPIIPPARYRQAFGVSDRPSYWLTEYDRLADGVNAGTRRITDAEYQNLVASYDAGIASMDAELGRFFDELKRLDLFERSLIIVTSDHGELFGRSGALGHDGLGIASGLFRVPLLVKFPGRFTPSDTERPVSGIDLYPTILDLCGIPGRDGEGRSLMTSVPFDRPLFFESFESARRTALNPRFRGDERAALVGDRLIAVNSRAPMPNGWPAGAQPLSVASDGRDRNLQHAYTVLRSLEAEGAGTSRPLPSRFVLDRLRSVGYVHQ